MSPMDKCPLSLAIALLLVVVSKAQSPLGGNFQQFYPISGNEGPCGPGLQYPMQNTLYPQRRPVPATGGVLNRVVRQASLNLQQNQAPLPPSNTNVNPPTIPQRNLNTRQNMADVLGLPAGMTVADAVALELDANNPYDLDLPDPGSPNVHLGINDVATGRGPYNPGQVNNQLQPNNLLRRRPVGGDPALRGSVYPNSPNQVQKPFPNGNTAQGNLKAIPQAGFVPQNNNPLLPNNHYGNNPYAPRVNCQCDSAEDCGLPAKMRGLPYNGQCIGMNVCCCRLS